MSESNQKGIMADDFEEEKTEEQLHDELVQKIQLFGNGLQRQFDEQVGLKEELEQRWLDDLRHYNGRYDRETEAKMSSGDGKNKQNTSRVFVNLTRAKSNIAESKWSDLVLPTDDRNWGIQPTPVPELVKSLQDNETPIALADGSVAGDPETGEPYTQKDMAEETMKQASKASDQMENEIDDQLNECKYNAVCRDIIHDAVVMGTGIIKGPMVERRAKKAWVQDKANAWVLDLREENKPTAAKVDPWNFFPDMSAVKWEDCEFTYERHLMTRKELRKLAKNPGFKSEKIAEILGSSPNARGAKLNYLNELREINGITQIQHDNRYEVLEYHGPVNKEDLVACGCKGVSLEDELEQYEGVVWFCMGIVFKVGINHMDTEELPYNVLNWEKDETNIFGFGVPYRMRAPQRVMNASWRMVLDNAGLSTGPQIVINKALVEPANGIWEMTPRKLWYMTTKDPKFRAEYAFQTFSIDNNQQELTNIFEMAHRLADEETSVPQMQMGTQPGDTQQPAMLKTLGGTALWMSSNNIMMRKAVKNFDDDITSPFITRFYDWNMQFNSKDDIKGDYSVDARGTSVLLVREMQARNLESFINAAMSMPGGPEELKPRGVLKSMAKGMQVSVDEVMRTDDEAETAQKKLEEQGPPPDIEMMKLELQREISMEESRRKIAELESAERQAQMTREVELMKIAANQEMDMEAMRGKHGIDKYKIDVGIKQFYEELLIKKQEGETANYGLEAEPS